MSKRVAGIQLTADNADEVDGEHEEAGEFQVASEAELKKRVIKTARRGRTMEDQSAAGSGSIFAKLKSLSASMARPTRSESTTSSIGPASFTAGAMYTFSSTSSATSSSTVSSVTSVISNDSLKKSAVRSSEYMEKLRELNMSVSAWISKNVKGNPYIDLSPIFDDYKRYWKTMESSYQDSGSSSSTTDSGVLVNDSDTGTSNTAKKSGVVTSEGTNKKQHEHQVFPQCEINRQTVEEDQRSVTEGLLPTVTLSLKGTGNWNVHVPQPTMSEGISETVPSSSQSATGSCVDAQSGTGSRQPTSGSSSHQMMSSTLESSSYTTLKATTGGDQPPGDQPPDATKTLHSSTTGSQYTSSITTEVKSKTKDPESGRSSQLGQQRGFLLAPTGHTDSAKVPFSGNKLLGSPLKPLSSTLNSQPASSFSGTPGGPLTSDSSFVGSTLATDQASNVLPSMKKAGSPQKGLTTPDSSSVPANQKDDHQEELTDSTKVTDVEDDSLYSSRAKLFYKKGEEFVDLGVGTLKVEAYPGKMARVLLRSDNSLKTVILNISVTSQIPLTLTKNNLLMLCPEPNPPLGIEVRPVGYLIRVKTPADAQRLLDVINAQTGNS